MADAQSRQGVACFSNGQLCCIESIAQPGEMGKLLFSVKNESAGEKVPAILVISGPEAIHGKKDYVVQGQDGGDTLIYISDPMGGPGNVNVTLSSPVQTTSHQGVGEWIEFHH
ncbi:hypothetical protein FRC09_014491 [Ceratobasidium sp. 395]|nr:hypothetical protein FRC09_014491 [Ceratobasidium sp. 395]